MKSSVDSKYFHSLIISLLIFILFQIIYAGTYVYFQNGIQRDITELNRYIETFSFYTMRYYYVENDFIHELYSESFNKAELEIKLERLSFEVGRVNKKIQNQDNSILFKNPEYLNKDYDDKLMVLLNEIEIIKDQIVNLQGREWQKSDLIILADYLKNFNTELRRFNDSISRIDDYKLNNIRNFLKKITIILDILLIFIIVSIILSLCSIFSTTMKISKDKNRLLLLNNRLNEALEELKSTQDNLIEEKKNSALNSLASNVAHELNTPLGVAITGISYLLDSSKEKINENDFFTEFVEICEVSMKSLNKAADIIKVLKQFNSNNQTNSIVEFSLSELFNYIPKSYGNRLLKSNIELKTEFIGDAFIKYYPHALILIVNELINNSLKHGFTESKSGNIDIVFKKNEFNLEIDYSDNGKGIEQSQHKKVFEPLYMEIRKEGSFGLGLSLIYNIVVSELKGHLSLESTKGKGMHLIITLPVS